MSTSREEQYQALSQAISRVVSPVMVCMALAVWFVHSLGDIEKCAPLKTPRKLADIPLYPVAGGDSSGPATYGTGVTVMFIIGILVLMVVLTFVIVWLYKSGRQRVIKIWLMVAVFLIFAYIGGLYMFDFCRSRCIPLDWVSLVLAVWNFTITGLYAVFGRVPRLINQAYLIVMSALMSYIFRSLPGYAVWIILAALVVWDLFAVLSRFGPLRMLVEAARTQGDELPALVYDTNPISAGREPTTRPAKASSLNTKPRPPRQSPRTSHTPMSTAAAPTNVTPISVPPPVPENGEAPAPPATIAPAPDATPASDAPDARPRRHRLPISLLRKGRRSASAAAAPPADGAALPDETIAREGDAAVESGAAAADGGGVAGSGPHDATATASGATNRRAQGGQRAENAIQVGTLGTHLKLGLGDFVFYSLLVSQASKAGTMTAVVSFVAVLAGLCATLFLVTVYRKALPALPISITAGLLFYVLTRFTVQPFTDNLVPELLFH